MGELLWYTVQLQHMGKGQDPDPTRHPLRNLRHNLVDPGVVGRPQRGFAA
jgi:hypothetical protein